MSQPALLDDILSRLDSMDQGKLATLAQEVDSATNGMCFVPNAGRQTEAYLSKADVLFYGGQAGGGKTGLLIGLALNEHHRSLIMRRQYTDLGAITEELLTFHGSREGFNGSPPPKLKRGDQLIELGAAMRIGDEQHWQGQAHDFIGFDEATHFAESQIRFLMGWVRSTRPGQRKRVVLASNPPITSEGLWVIEMFAPWLDERYPDPAEPGELRWVVSDEDGNDLWVDGPDPVEIGGKMQTPLSRTFIPAGLKDNPYLSDTGYAAQLDAMPEPYRSAMRDGKFASMLQDSANQCIPTLWVREAQKRWKETPPNGIPMCCIGVDCSGGGRDPMILAPRYDGWYAPLVKVPGKEIPMDRAGAYSAGIVISHRRDNADVVVDLGGGYGGPLYEHLKANSVDAIGYKGAESSSRRSRDGKLKFFNKRSAAYWLFREALDPGQPGGSPISLPDDPRIISTLTAPSFEIGPNGIKVESKEKVVERLGYSTDESDAIVMSWYEGAKETNSALEWLEHRGQPKVLSGGRAPLTARRK